MARITKNQFISGSLWKITEQFSTKGLSLLFSIVLARILSADDYGLIALTAVFLNLSDILIDGGFSAALIQKKEVDDYDYSSVLIVSMGISAFLYLIIFLIAPFAARYYRAELLTAVLRVIGIILFVQAFSSIRNAYVNRNMQFKLLFRCNFLATLVSGILGVASAYAGAGVWALVIQRLSQQILLTALLLIRLKWRFRFMFSFERMKSILKFSIGVVSAALINYGSSSLYSLIIGRKYSVADLGYYDKGGQLPTQVSLYTFGAMSSVLLPTLSSYQTELDRVKAIVRKVTQMTSFLIAPMMAGLAMVTRELVILLFTEKWLPIVRIMQWNCLYYLATPFMLINIQVFLALGYSNMRVKTELIRFVMLLSGVLVFGILLSCTINQLALVCAVVAVLSAIVTYIAARPMIGYSVREALADTLPAMICAAVMGACVYLVGDVLLPMAIALPNAVLLLVKLLTGVAVYAALAAVFRIKGFDELLKLAKTILGRKKTA